MIAAFSADTILELLRKISSNYDKLILYKYSFINKFNYFEQNIRLYRALIMQNLRTVTLK